MISLKQLFYAALIARIGSIVSLGVFFYCIQADVELRVAVLSLGLSFTGWLVGSFFVGLYNTGTTSAAVAAIENEIEKLGTIEEVDYNKKSPIHPLFEEDNDNE